MKKIPIDVSGCRNEGDVYDLLLAGLEAPRWHGRNFDALWDSVTRDINAVLPPYLVEVAGHRQVPEEVALLVSRIRSLFEEAREGHRADVRLKLV
ncbi:barstar family protein [Roseovarius indicus]|uniref:barstar family protein n=1 Tax=Roseovarius indicus TaxID=540747 RepID=UPI00137475D2|nr:barstar family protein [Roseovarius indicus]